MMMRTPTQAEFDNAEEAKLAYAEYEQACAEWDNLDLPRAIEDVYIVFLGAAHQWNRFRPQRRQGRDIRRNGGQGDQRRSPKA